MRRGPRLAAHAVCVALAVYGASALCGAPALSAALARPASAEGGTVLRPTLSPSTGARPASPAPAAAPVSEAPEASALHLVRSLPVRGETPGSALPEGPKPHPAAPSSGGLILGNSLLEIPPLHLAGPAPAERLAMANAPASGAKPPLANPLSGSLTLGNGPPASTFQRLAGPLPADSPATGIAPPEGAGPPLARPAPGSLILRNGPLEGTFLRPAGPVYAVALILPGSGPADRDGNQPGLVNHHLRLLAVALAAQGIASLRADKRGVGASAAGAPGESDLRFETYVEDARSWLDLLRGSTGGPLVLIGHSEGALVATLAAGGADALVLIAGAAEPAGALIARQLAGAGLPDDLQQSSARIAAALRDGRPVPEVPPALAPLYRPSVQPYLASWFRHDPAQALAALPEGLPVLIMQGGTDLQVFPDQAERLAAARPQARRLTLPAMNHILREAPAGRAGNLATYTRPDLPLAPGLAQGLADFITALPR